ncbi:hypothetical protein QR680_001740 [Steinernema hermaphroditum]|uniref:SAM domain-containing protein n=1 Tax=Steinernema hermaphroditum TaxID=289476 RepID=A0AA39LGL5_9BILA|nr:hypothetical protein QR680_001740 [Steinernema hermaphroditum]
MSFKRIDETLANLFHFTHNDDVLSVEEILKSDIRLVNFADDDLVTCLHIAAGKGCLEMVKLLLNYGSDPDACDILGTTPLFHAVANGDVDVVKELVLAGANIAHISDLQTDVISVAVVYGHFEIIKYLQTCHPTQSALLTPQRRLAVLAACLVGDIDVVLYFTMFWRSDIDAVWLPFERLNALGLAVVLCDIELMQLLLDLGASATAPSLNHLSATELCSMFGCGEDIRKCLAKHDLMKAQQRIDRRVAASPLRSSMYLSPKPQRKPKNLLASYTMTDLERLFASSWSSSSGQSSLVDSVSEPPDRMKQRFSDSSAATTSHSSFGISLTYESLSRSLMADSGCKINYAEASKIHDDESLQEYLNNFGLQKYLSTFNKEGIDLEAFLFMRENDLVSLGIDNRRDRKKMRELICFLNAR